MSETIKSSRELRTDVVARTAPPYVHPNVKRRMSARSSTQPPVPLAKKGQPSVPGAVPKSNSFQRDTDEDDMFEAAPTSEVVTAGAACPDEVEVETEPDQDAGPDFATGGMTARLKDEKGVFVPLVLGYPLCKNGNEMLVLAQLVYWVGRTEKGKIRARIHEDGYHWVAKTYEELADETGLAARQVRHAVRGLVKRGVLVKRDRSFCGRRSNFLRIRTAAFSECLPL